MTDERRDDWKAGVDDRLMSLTSSQRITDDQLDDLDLKYEAIDKVMRGDPEEDTDGIISRIHNLENAIQELRAERVKFKVEDVTAKGLKWQAWAAIIVGIAGLLAGLLPNIGRIRSSVTTIDDTYRPDEKLRREIEADKRKHHKKWKVKSPLPTPVQANPPSIPGKESPPKSE
jgi:hypothetical protein